MLRIFIELYNEDSPSRILVHLFSRKAETSIYMAHGCILSIPFRLPLLFIEYLGLGGRESLMGRDRPFSIEANINDIDLS